jgi:amino acid transporter
MVAVSFGSYASAAFADGGNGWTKSFAVLVVVVMSLLNILGSRAVARVQTVVVVVVIGILTVFAITTLATLDPELLAFSGATAITIVIVLLLSIVLDLAWKRTRDKRPVAS